MASLATCPLCAKQLAVPKEASADDRAQCPECDATFLLSNAFQVALPMVRLLAPEENLEEEPEEETPREEPKEVQPDEVTAVESLSSWEARLKNAIERDTSEIADEATGQKQTAKPSPEPTTVAPQSEFEFHLDPTPAEMPRESEIKSTKQAAQVDLLAAENAQSFAEELNLPKNDLPRNDAPKNVEVAAVSKEPKLHLNTSRPRPRRSFSPLKAAAILLGPGIVGIFLGLYALLWIKGPSGDVLNLAQHLPTAMLPYADSANEAEKNTPTDAEQLLAATPPQEDAKEISEPLPFVPESQLEPPRRDESVQLAAAEEPLPQTTTSLPESFTQLLAAAQSAQPGLVEGDLTNNAAVARKGQAYMAVCRLAQEFDWLRDPSLDVNSQAQITAAQQVFDAAASDGAALRDLASIVSRWWGYEARPNQGIFLVGQIQNVQPLGGQTLCHIALDDPASATIIPVLLDHPPAQGASRILVVGKIVKQPPISQQTVPQQNNNLQGSATDLPQVVDAPYSRVLQP